MKLFIGFFLPFLLLCACTSTNNQDHSLPLKPIEISTKKPLGPYNEHENKSIGASFSIPLD